MSRPARNPATLLALAALAVPLMLRAQQPHPDSIAALRAGFLNPPNDARPMVRWWWFGPAVVKPEILRELQQMKADGIGGAELAFVYPEVLDDPAKDLKNLPFLSPQMLDAVRYAQTEGRKLGLRIDITLCSGWPYGGPAIPLDQAVTRLRIAEVAVPAGAKSITLPAFAVGEQLLSASIADGEPKRWSLASSAALPLQIPTDSRELILDPKPAPRVALFFIQSHTRQQVKRAAVGAEGYVLDPFSKQAVATHLKSVGEPLLSAFGSTPPYAIFSDSLEAYGADWTPDLPQQFKQRRGYDLMQHLPELVAGGTTAAEKVRHDYGRTLTELVDENYLTQIDAWAKAHHTLFRSQTYGDPAVDFSSQNLVGLAEGEGPQWRAFSTLRWATSANHVFGHNVTSGETFTWLHSPVFRATPLDMKAEADIDFIMGENQLIFHGWPYSPPASELKLGDPGWSLYAAAVFNDHNPWHPVMPAVTQYITRLSWLLRQGQPANQVAILLPTDDAWANFSPGHTSVTDAMKTLISPELMSTMLSAGYNVDYIDAKAIDKVGLGDHQILVIPPTDHIPVETLQKLHEWAAHGGHIIALGHAPTLDAEGNPSAEINQLSEAIAVIPGTDQLAQALHNAAKPDLGFGDGDAGARSQIGFIHRKLENADVYFIANTSNQTIRTTISFSTQYAGGEVLDPESGRHEEGIDSQAVQIDLAPYASQTLLFDQQQAPVPLKKVPGGRSIEAIVDGWKVTYPSLQRTTPVSLPNDWTQDPSTLHYSGEAVYERDAPMHSGIKTSHSRLFLVVPGGTALPGSPTATPEHDLLPNGLPNPLVTRTGPGMHAYFDPPIREAALVVINGKPAGALWHPPYRLDVTDVMHTGTNHIEIHVYNTALNAWSAILPHDYGPLKAKYGDRFQMQDLDRVKPVPSGILGPVELESDWTIK